jgi:hypothetical protein
VKRGAIGVGCLVVLAALATDTATGRLAGPATTVVVTVTASKLTFSTDTLPVGVAEFRIVNRSGVPRTFIIGAGRTRLIPAGGSADLHVVLSAGGFYTARAPGTRRALPLSSLIDVFEPCATPTTTTVSVRMAQDQGGITLSQTTIPCGTVTFAVTNAGTHTDSLQIFGEQPGETGSTPELQPGQTATIVVQFLIKGTGYYQSGTYPPAEPEFAGDYGEGGQFTVT